MDKSEIRKKILKIRRENIYRNFEIDFNNILNILKKNKTTNKIVGGYYPYNYEVNAMNILKSLEKQNYQILVEKKMPKRILSGVVISSNSNKTITVDVTRRIKHKLYKKIIRQTKKYHAHDENNEFNVGDTVSIIESKPFSKLKKWRVLSNAGDKS